MSWPTSTRSTRSTSPDELLHRHPEAALAHLDGSLPSDGVVFPVLHGPFGEDGVIQGHLEALAVPYVGAGVLASAICMDKGISKSVLHDHGLPVAAWRLVARSSWSADVREEAVEALGLPIFVKPANLGSSIGVAKVSHPAGLGDAALSAFRFDDHVILEEFVGGRELELAVMGNDDVRVSRAGEIVASRDFYDYEDKYLLGAAETIAPTDLKDAQLADAQRLAAAAYRALRVEGLARRRPLPLRRGRDRGQRSEHHAGLHPDLHVPHALGGRGHAVRGRRPGAGRIGAGPARPAAAPAHPPGSLRLSGPGGGWTGRAPPALVGHDRRRSHGCCAHPFCTVRSVVMTFEGFESDTWEALPGANRLTMAQREAIESDEPLLCVVAGAGAGKTRVLTLRVARRVREGSIEPDRTLVTTFSRKAAEELRTRLYSLGVSGVKAGTFHRTALGLAAGAPRAAGAPTPPAAAGPPAPAGRGHHGRPPAGPGPRRRDRLGQGTARRARAATRPRRAGTGGAAA